MSKTSGTRTDVKQSPEKTGWIHKTATSSSSSSSTQT